MIAVPKEVVASWGSEGFGSLLEYFGLSFTCKSFAPSNPTGAVLAAATYYATWRGELGGSDWGDFAKRILLRAFG